MISPRFVSGIRCKPCDCRMANPSHTGIIAIPPPAQRLCSCRAESGCPVLPAFRTVRRGLLGHHLRLSGAAREERRTGACHRKWKRTLRLIPKPLHRRLMAWSVMCKTQDLSSGERRLMQGLCDVLKQLLSKPYQRHMADLLIDAASHADMVTADFARWAGRVLLILRRRPHLQSGEQGRAGTPDAGSDRRHRSHRRSSRAVGAHGRVHGYRTRLHRVACGPLLAGVSSLASDPSAEAGTRAPRPAAPRWTARRARLVVCDA